MKRLACIGLVLLAAAPALLAQEARDGSGAPAEASLDPALVAALRRDPRTLPQAAEGRWRTFGTASAKEAAPPQGLQAVQAALRANDLPSALAQLHAVLEGEPDYPPALHQTAVLYFRLQRYGDAIVMLERFVAQAPHKIGETRVLGHCYYTLGRYAQAKSHYELVLAASPGEVEALRGLALSEMRLGNLARGLELLRRVLELEPEHVEALTWMAQMLFDDGRSEEALVQVERARDLDPFQPRPWYLLGQILVDLGRDKDAQAAQARYQELDAATQALRSVEGRLRYEPHDMGLLARLVEIHSGVGNIPRTREALARLLRERPEDVALRIKALDVLEKLRDAEGASTAARALAQVGQDDADAWKRLEAYYARVKDRVKQIEAGERAKRLKSD